MCISSTNDMEPLRRCFLASHVSPSGLLSSMPCLVWNLPAMAKDETASSAKGSAILQLPPMIFSRAWRDCNQVEWRRAVSCMSTVRPATGPRQPPCGPFHDDPGATSTMNRTFTNNYFNPPNQMYVSYLTSEAGFCVSLSTSRKLSFPTLLRHHDDFARTAAFTSSIASYPYSQGCTSGHVHRLGNTP